MDSLALMGCWPMQLALVGRELFHTEQQWLVLDSRWQLANVAGSPPDMQAVIPSRVFAGVCQQNFLPAGSPEDCMVGQLPEALQSQVSDQSDHSAAQPEWSLSCRPSYLIEQPPPQSSAPLYNRAPLDLIERPSP